MSVLTDSYGRVLHTDPSDGVERRTIEGWNEVHADTLQVIDPDGFDRSDPLLFTRPFTYEEWRAGAMRSTCRFRPGFFV